MESVHVRGSLPMSKLRLDEQALHEPRIPLCLDDARSDMAPSGLVLRAELLLCLVGNR